MDAVITKEMIRDGLHSGIIMLVSSESVFRYSVYGIEIVDLHLNEGEIMCRIGDYQFYFAGLEGETCIPSDYIKNTPQSDIIDEIYEALESMRDDDVDNDEYMYYFYHLSYYLM